MRKWIESGSLIGDLSRESCTSQARKCCADSPRRTMARSFSNALNDLFKIDNSLADLDAAVEEKSVNLSTNLIAISGVTDWPLGREQSPRRRPNSEP